MSMPISNAANNKIFTDNHFAHHPNADKELADSMPSHLNSENIYVRPLVRGNNHNYDGGSVVEIRQLEIGKQGYWPFNYVTAACKESDGISITGNIRCGTWKASSVLDGIYGGVCKKAHVSAALEAGLRFNLTMDSKIPNTIHEITLGPGCNVPGYAGTTIGYLATHPLEKVENWQDTTLPRIDIYIDQIMTVSGVANSSGFALAALLNANIGMGNDPIIGIEAYPGTAEIHAKIGYKVIPGDENAHVKRMTLQPSSLPELFELKNGEWNYIGK